MPEREAARSAAAGEQFLLTDAVLAPALERCPVCGQAVDHENLLQALHHAQLGHTRMHDSDIGDLVGIRWGDAARALPTAASA